MYIDIYLYPNLFIHRTRALAIELTLATTACPFSKRLLFP